MLSYYISENRYSYNFLASVFKGLLKGSDFFFLKVISFHLVISVEKLVGNQTSNCAYVAST